MSDLPPSGLGPYGAQGVPSLGPQGDVKGAYLSWTDASGAYQSLIFDLVEGEHWGLGSKIPQHPVEVGANTTDNVHPLLRTVTLRIHVTNEPIAANQWSGASLMSAGAITAPTISISPGTGSGKIDAVDWDNQLTERVLAGTASGFLGGAIGGAVGGGAGSAVGGALGAVAGSAIAGGLFPGKAVDRILHSDAPILAKLPSGPFTFHPRALAFDTPGDFVRLMIEQLETLNQTGQTIDVWGSKSACVGPPGIGGMGIESLEHDRSKDTGTGAEVVLTLRELRIVSTTTVPAPKPQHSDSTGSVSKGNQQTSSVTGDGAAGAIADAAGAFVQGYTAGQADTAAVLQ